MPQFIQLSKVSLNVNTIKGITPVPPKSKAERGCIVYFIDGKEPHLFYGSDAEALFALVNDNQMKSPNASQLVGAK